MQTLKQLFNKMTYQNFLQYRTHVQTMRTQKLTLSQKLANFFQNSPKITTNCAQKDATNIEKPSSKVYEQVKIF